MATNGIQSTVSINQSEEKVGIIDQIKGFINPILSKVKQQMAAKKSDEGKDPHKFKQFIVNRRNAQISVIIAVCMIIFAAVYSYIVVNNYNVINENTISLKEVKTYNISPDRSLLDTYIGSDNPDTIVGIATIRDRIEEELHDRELFKEQQKNYYNVFLNNIYLPSLNVWKHPYTQDFDMSVMGQKYLDLDKYQNLYLMQYRSDFIKYVGNDADYNVIEHISIGDTVEVENSDYFYKPISVEFTSPSKRSFLLLVNKISMTSNPTNIALLNEFFFYLIANIKEHKNREIEQLMNEYRSDFANSSNWTGFGNAKSVSELSEQQLSDYQDKVIGYNLYNMIHYEGTGEVESPLIDDKLILETIKENVLCNNSISQKECLYNFRDKYKSIPYLAYGIGLGSQDSRTEGFIDFLKNLPQVLAITDFGFEKSSNGGFLTTSTEQYQGTIEFRAYGKNITKDDLDEASSVLGSMCFGEGEKLSIDKAIERVNNSISSLGGESKSSNVSTLEELQGVFSDIKPEYEGMSNYDKMIKLFELRRMLNDANLCTL